MTAPLPHASRSRSARSGRDDRPARAVGTVAGYTATGRLAERVGGVAQDDSGDPVHLTVVDASDEAAQDDLAQTLRALDRLDHPHIQAFVDVGGTRSGDIALVTRPALDETLSSVLSRRTTLDRGETVTVVGPIVSAVRHCHDQGVVHGSISSAAIGLTADGAPFLMGFGESCVSDDLAERDRRAQADVAALIAVARECLGSEVDDFDEGADLDHFEGALFSIATPNALRRVGTDTSSRLALEVNSTSGRPAQPDEEDGVEGSRASKPLPSTGRRRAEGTYGLRRVVTVVARRRGPVLVAVCTVAAATTAIVSVPAVNHSAEGPVNAISSSPEPTRGGLSMQPATQPPTAAPPLSAPVGSEPDPAMAAVSLRAGLLACASAATCRGGLLEDGARFDAEGAERLDVLVASGNAAIRVVDRNGDAATIATESASGLTVHALLVRTDGRWRIRDVYRGRG